MLPTLKRDSNIIVTFANNNKHKNEEDPSVSLRMSHGGSVVLDYKISIKQIIKEIQV